MKKALVLTAIAATLAAPAFAQSSVTVYGRLNVTLESRKINGLTDKGVFNNSSRIGFKGVEDLGGGLKAGFQLEHGFNPATGAAGGTFWGRQSEANLSGAFGMIRLGNFTSEAYFATADYISMHNHDTGISADALYADANGFNQSRKIAYRLPAMGGFSAEIAALEGSPTTARGYDLAANYDAGALHLGAGFGKKGDAKEFAVRALYELGAFTLGGYVQRDTDAILGAGSGSRTNFRLAGMYTMGATELHLNFGKAGDIGGVSGTDGKQLTLGVNQNLSKRTKIYGFYTKLDSGTAGVYGEARSLALGVRHNF